MTTQTEIKIAILHTGQQVIVEVEQLGDGKIKLINPTVFGISQGDSETKVNLILQPLIPFSKDNTMVAFESNIILYEPSPDLENKYRSMFSKIIKPSSSLLQGL